MIVKKAKNLNNTEIFTFDLINPIKYVVIFTSYENGIFIKNIITESFDVIRNNSTLKVFVY